MRKIVKRTLIGAAVLLLLFVIWAVLIGPRYLRDQVQGRVVQAMDDVTAVAGAVESFHGEFGVYPNHLSQLTTPVALLTAIPPDVWATDLGTPLGYATTEEGYIVYSRGPDQRDDGGVPGYDPTNGLISYGDIAWPGPR